MHKKLLPALVAAGALTLSACGSSGGSGGGDTGDVVVGSTLSLTCPRLLGSLQKQGYEQAVAWVNEKGGIDFEGKKRKVKLIVQDDESDPNMASQQARSLVLQSKAEALLGPCTPPVTIPVAQVAEVQRIPMVATCTPAGAFAAGSKRPPRAR